MGATAPASAPAETTKQRTKGKFVILVRAKGSADGWAQQPSPVEAVTADQARTLAARSLADHTVYGEVIKGDGLEIVAVSVRSFKAVVAKVEPQPSKVVLG